MDQHTESHQNKADKQLLVFQPLKDKLYDPPLWLVGATFAALLKEQAPHICIYLHLSASHVLFPILETLLFVMSAF